MAHRRTRMARTSGPRRQTEWLSLEFQTSGSNLAASSKVLVAQMDAVEQAKLPFTITRTVGLISVWSDQIAATESNPGAFGGTIVSDRATVVGITAIPDPVTEHNADFWFLYEPFQCVGGPDGDQRQINFQMKFDSRAQRKVQEGDDIVFVLANGGSTGIIYLINLRMLIKLH